MNRRSFIVHTSVATGSLLLLPGGIFAESHSNPAFQISLAQWSLNRNLFGGKLNNLEFPKLARREFGIDAVEYVDQFFADKSKDQTYLKELKNRTDGEGIYNHLIMIDTTGPLGAAQKSSRDSAVEKTFGWIDAARFLGCRMIRVNAYGDGNAEELRERVAESGARLADYAAQAGLAVAIENHGKLSSDPGWLVSLIRAINKPNFGILPDFGNFPDEVNRYRAVEAFMPYAKAVSAKSERFDHAGLVADTDFFHMMRIVRDGGYTGYVGIESSGGSIEGEYDAIRKTKETLLRVREQQSRCQPLFNGQDLSGWTRIEGGDWTIEKGVLIGRRGVNWSTNPERTGSWLSTEKEYGDFRLEFQFTVNKGGNSGVFIRSSHQRNPAFTGYEMQIHDSPGRPPSKGGPGSLYDVVAPDKNVIRQAGEWNYATITAKGPKIIVEMNGEKILETEQTRSMKGYIGLQNHDDKSECRFKNIRLEVL